MNRLHRSIVTAAAALTLCASAATAQNGSLRPDSDAGRPSGPMNPPGVVTPLSGNGVTPLGPNYIGDPPDPTANGFQNPPGFLPRGRQVGGSGRASPTVPMVLPPAASGRQGLPPQTWNLLTPWQQDLHRQAQTAAMSSTLGEGFVWDDAGRHGEVRVVADRMFNNRPCRDFVHVVLIDGQRIEGTTTICR